MSRAQLRHHRLLVACALWGLAACSSGEPEPSGGGAGGAAAAGSGGAGTGGAGGGGTGGVVAPGGAGGTGGAGGVSAAGGAGGTPPGDGPAPADAPADAAGAEAAAPADGGGDPPAGGELLIYWVDTEGGACTILRAPTGEILVTDTGFPGNRDAIRAMAVLQGELKATKVDYLLTTHYDPDHTGGVGYIASRLPVGTFLDHGDGGLPAGYRGAVAGKTRKIIQPGDVIQLGAVKLAFVSSARRLIPQPLPGAPTTPNPHCQGATNRGGDDENAASVGYVASWGRFDFVNLGDLLWGLEHDLACPVNKLGQVDLYQTTHHGQAQSGAPQLIHAMEPLVAVMNNGAGKGGATASFGNLTRSPGFQALWQVHRSNQAGGANAPDERIVNSSGPDQARWLKATVRADGSFTLFNPRNEHSATYQAR